MKQYIAGKIGRNWKRFARLLEFDEAIIDNIDLNDDNVSLNDKGRSVMAETERYEELKWKKIKHILFKLDLAEVVSEFEKMYFSDNKIQLPVIQCIK